MTTIFSQDRFVRIWFALLELAWDQSQTQQGSGKKNARKGGMSAPNASRPNGDARDFGLARKAAVAVLLSGPWSPEKNREMLVLQVCKGNGFCFLPTPMRQSNMFSDGGEIETWIRVLPLPSLLGGFIQT